MFALATLALPTYALTHQPTRLTHFDTRGQLQDVNLAEVVSTAQAQGDGADGLPTAWCGDELRSNYPDTTAKPAFKVVYAYASDRPNRFTGWMHALQANVALVERFLSAQSGGTKALRFDMGTRCGAQYVDIQVVALPGPRAAFADNFTAIANAVRNALGTSGTPRNTIILADGLAGGTHEYGLGETIMGTAGEQPGTKNVHNRGGLTSILFSRDGASAPGNARWGWWPEGFLHEASHNLGAVQWGAPHSTQPLGKQLPQYGHCFQGADVMCYAEDSGARSQMVNDCAGLPGAIPQNYDCGRDDYFNPAPSPGSYLATHWNTYDSSFMAPCGEIAPACGGGNMWVPEPPAASVAPAVAGSARRGSTLTARAGTWSNAPTEYTFQWQRLVASGWKNIEGETEGTYVVTSDDLGRRLRVTVIASNPDGSASAASAPTAPIGAAGVNRAASSTSCGTARAKASGKAKAKASRKAKKKVKAKAASCKPKAKAAKRKKSKRR
ncbi:MAG TPA: hypothetical protein VFZ00_09985 [Solirubrobacter sp.]|nr:hypothetical protein [Solirubrobacter sp.]